MANENEFVIEKVINAPCDFLFRVWTEPEHLMHWWGPEGFIMDVCQVDLRPGGIFHYQMKSPDGADMWGKFVYHDIIPPEKLVFVVSFSDAEGNNTRHPLSATWPLEILNTFVFEEQHGKTKMILRGIPFNANPEEQKTFEEGFSSMNQGFSGTINQLEEYLLK